MSFPTFDVDNKQIFRLDGDVGILDGNVGIGTTPTEALDVSGNVNVGYNSPHPTLPAADFLPGRLTIRSAGANSAAELYLATPLDNDAGHKVAIIAQNLTGAGGYSRSKLMFCLENTTDNNITATTDHTRMTILPSGKVGIGITDPLGANLHIKDSDGDAVLKIGSNSEGTDSKILLGTPYDAGSAYKVGIIAEALPGYSRAKLHFCLNNNSDNTAPTYDASLSNSRMTILPSGEVGIGTTSPTTGYKLDVNGNVKATKFVGNLESTNVDIDGGAIDGTTIGATTASSGKFTTLSTSGLLSANNGLTIANGKTLTSNTVDINGGAINGTTIGATTASSGNFTTLSANNFSSVVNNNSQFLSNTQSNISANNFIFTKAIVNYQQTGATPSAIVFGNGNIYGNNEISLITSGQTRFYVKSDGNVGIGTDNPINKLEVPVSDYYDGICTRSADVRMVLGTAGTGNNSASIQVFRNVTDSTPTSSSNKFPLLLNPLGGSIGIGNTLPFTKLTIGSTSSTNTDVDEISFRSANNSATDRIGYKQRIAFYGKNEYDSGNHEVASIECLYGDNVYMPNYHGYSSSQLIFSTHPRSGAISAEKMRINGLGHVGIGTNNPGYPLDIKGSTGLSGTKTVYFSSGLGSYNGNSSVTMQAEWDVKATAYIVTSDERIKKDILDINDDAALQKLRIIEPKTYKYKDVASRGTKTVFGFIAQQIDTVLPEAVSKLNDVIPNTYELCDATSSSNNDYYDTITFTNFNTANLDTSSNNLVLVDANNKNHSVNITAVLDSSSVQVDTDLLEWMGAVDASNETVIANEVQTYEKVILDASNNVVLENYDVSQIATLDASENVVGKMVDLTGDNTIDSSNNYVDVSGNFIAGPINTNGHYIDASGNYFDASGNFKDASNNLIGTYKAEWKNVIVHGTKIFVYGQTVNDFHALNKDYIFTVATAALQEVDRQLQAEKAKVSVLESDLTAEKAKTSTLETQMADLLTRVSALEST